MGTEQAFDFEGLRDLGVTDIVAWFSLSYLTREGCQESKSRAFVFRKANLEGGEWLAHGNSEGRAERPEPGALFHAATTQVESLGSYSQPLEASHQFHWSLKIKTHYLVIFRIPMLLRKGFNNQGHSLPTDRPSDNNWGQQWHGKLFCKNILQDTFHSLAHGLFRAVFSSQQQPLGYFMFLFQRQKGGKGGGAMHSNYFLRHLLATS